MLKSLAMAGLLAAALTVGCKKEETAHTPATPGAPAAATDSGPAVKESYEGITFDRPAGWVREASTDPVGILIRPAGEDGQRAYIFLESNKSAADVSLPSLMEKSAEDLYGSKPDYSQKSKDTLQHPGGFEYGRIVFTSSRGGTTLKQSKLIIPVGKESRIFAQTTTPDESAAKYEPMFDKIVASIRVEKK